MDLSRPDPAFHAGLHRSVDLRQGVAPEGIPMPRCSIAQLWGDLPKDAVAEFRYHGAGYQLDVRGTAHQASFDLDCHKK